VAGIFPSNLGAQNTYFFPEGESLDPEIPSPEEYLGYPIGTFVTRQDRVVAYFQELARLSDRATYQSIGQTFEFRQMPLLTVTSPANHRRLEEIRLAHLASIEPGAPPAEGLPIIAHLGYNVHGNEASAGEAALLTAYWLVAGRGAEIDRYLDEGVFHIEPTLNPDGRDRFAHWTSVNRAIPFVADPLDREHNEGWPGGRTNHYWFDLNRDWFPLVNPESQARIEFHHRWHPNVVTDHHEMGTSSSFFFEPTKPVGTWNPLLPERLYTDLTMTFAEYWSEALDDMGSLYFTGETFDNSYPGYGSSYPNFLGGLAVLFEQASSRGIVQESSHHGQLTFAFTIRNQLRAAMATVQASVEHRESMQEYQRDFYASALSEGDAYEINGWIFGDPHDQTLNREFIEFLLRHRIAIGELTASREGDGITFQPGRAWVVPASQPMYRLARSIFERVETFADSVFYDASAWTVSLAYGMPDLAVTSGSLPMGDPITDVPDLVETGPVARSSISYLMDWKDSGAPRALQAMQAAGVRAEVAFLPFTAATHGGPVSFSRGSISTPVSIQTIDADSLHAVVSRVSRATQVPIHAARTGRSVDGIDLGSNNFRPVRTPRVLLPVGDGVSSYEVGQLWHLLDQRIAMPVTKVDVSDLGRVDWGDFDALVLVSGATGAFSGPRLEALKVWVRNGGTLIVQRNAAAWATRNGLTPNIPEPGMGRPVDEQSETEDDAPDRRDYADARNFEGPQAIGGSIWEADLDLTHPLGFGYQRRTLPIWRDHNMFFAPSRNAYSTVARLDEDDPFLSGYVSDLNRTRLRGSPSVMVDRFGGGAVILFVDNTNFRGYWRGTNRLFLNALFFGDHIQVP
jgi:hypothetical protein